MIDTPRRQDHLAGGLIGDEVVGIGLVAPQLERDAQALQESHGLGLGGRHRKAPQTIARTTPPSTRSAAPLVAEASGLHTYTIMLATSSTVANRFRSEVGRADWKNSASTTDRSTPR